MSIWLVVFVAFVALLVGIALHGLRPASERDVDRWVDRHGLDVGQAGRASARLYLSWIRPWRTLGLLVGLAPFLKWILFDRMDQVVPWASLWFGLGVVGYLGGSIIAEITFPSVAQASLTQISGAEAELKPRELRTFLSGSMTILPWGVAVLALLLLPIYLLMADPAYVGTRLAGVIWASALVLVTAVSVRLAMSRIVDRPRPVTSGELLRVDQAERASSLHTIALAEIALELLLLSVLVSEIGRALENRPQHMFMEPVSWLSAGLVVLAVLVWIGGASGRTPSSFGHRAGT